MRWRDVLSIAGLVVPTVIGVATLVMSVSQSSRGSEADRHLTLHAGPAISPLAALSVDARDVTVSFTIDGRQIDNLLASDNAIQNTGMASIDPKDIDVPITVSVAPPWEIVAVRNWMPLQSLQLEWERMNAQTFKAKPAIINAGEAAFPLVYITNPTIHGQDAKQLSPAPALQWQVHGRNLNGFTMSENSARLTRALTSSLNLRVELIGWGVPLTVILATVSEASYLVLMYLAGWFKGPRWQSLAFVLAASVISYCASEAVATYLFDTPNTIVLGVNHWLNAPFIALQTVTTTYLAYRVFKSRPITRSL